MKINQLTSDEPLDKPIPTTFISDGHRVNIEQVCIQQEESI